MDWLCIKEGREIPRGGSRRLRPEAPSTGRLPTSPP